MQVQCVLVGLSLRERKILKQFSSQVDEGNLFRFLTEALKLKTETSPQSFSRAPESLVSFSMKNYDEILKSLSSPEDS